MLCYSTGSLPDGFSPSQIAEALLPTPFRGVEVVLTSETLNRFREESFWLGFRLELEMRGFCIRNVHLGNPYLLGAIPHHPGLGSLNSAERNHRIEAALSAAHIATALHSPYLTLTTGMPEHAGNIRQQEILVHKSLVEIVARKPKALRLALEQEPEHIIRSADQLIHLCHAFPGEVFANFDVGHSAVAGENIPQVIKTLAPHLSNIHLEDIHAQVHRHLLFGKGDIDFKSIFLALAEIGYAGDLTPDLYPFKDESAHALQASAEFLAEFGFFR